jgi:hypothetical protein
LFLSSDLSRLPPWRRLLRACVFAWLAAVTAAAAETEPSMVWPGHVSYTQLTLPTILLV